MKFIKLPLLLICVLIISYAASAQKVLFRQGKLDFLKGEKNLKLEYVYDGMSVGRYSKEADYVKQKRDDYNKKEPGRGDKWVEAWQGDRVARFEPKFEELFDKYMAKAGINCGKTESAKYTLLLKTTRTEPGFNIHIARKNAQIDVTATFVETDNPSTSLAVIEIKRVPGRTFGGFDYDSGTRLEEAYAKCGKELGKFIVGLVKKK